MAKYSDEYRATAIAMMVAEGYPDDSTAIKRVHGQVAEPKPNVRTLRYWFQHQHQPAPEKLIQDKKDELADLFEQAAKKYVSHAIKDDVVSKSSGAGAMTAAAIAVDKMRLLRDLPTEIIGVLGVVQDAYAAIAAIGEDPETVFRKLAEAARKRVASQPALNNSSSVGKG